jgi:hypothetical protein
MNTVHKFPIDRDAATERDGCLVLLSPGARILHVDLQDGNFFLWAIVDTMLPKTESRRIIIAGTGWDLGHFISRENSLHHVNTVLEPSHTITYVWHVFERVTLPALKA